MGRREPDRRGAGPCPLRWPPSCVTTMGAGRERSARARTHSLACGGDTWIAPQGCLTFVLRSFHGSDCASRGVVLTRPSQKVLVALAVSSLCLGRVLMEWISRSHRACHSTGRVPRGGHQHWVRWPKRFAALPCTCGLISVLDGVSAVRRFSPGVHASRTTRTTWTTPSCVAAGSARSCECRL